MAAVEVTITGVLYDKLNRTTQQVVLIGEASLTGLGVGGGPIIPPPGDIKPPVQPPGIWGPGDPRPTPPIAFPPGWVGGVPPNLPPDLQPPEPPSPGDPTRPVPPPAGSPGWPVQPIVVPPYMVIWYPGIGPVVVAPPADITPSA